MRKFKESLDFVLRQHRYDNAEDRKARRAKNKKRKANQQRSRKEHGRQ